jgi:hypothetical protein
MVASLPSTAWLVEPCCLHDVAATARLLTMALRTLGQDTDLSFA